MVRSIKMPCSRRADPRHSHLQAEPALRVVTSRQDIPQPEPELRQTAFYREVMKPQGWRHAAALLFWPEAPTFPILSLPLYRRPGRKDFTAREVALLDSLQPLLQPTLQRFHQSSSADALTAAIAVPLHRSSHAMLVLDAEMRVVRANLAAKRACARWGDLVRTRESSTVLDAEIESQWSLVFGNRRLSSLNVCLSLNDDRSLDRTLSDTARSTRLEPFLNSLLAAGGSDHPRRGVLPRRQNPPEPPARNLHHMCGDVRPSREVALAHSISQVRKALRSGALEAEFIETVPKRGYRFIGELAKNFGETRRLSPSSLVRPTRYP